MNTRRTLALLAGLYLAQGLPYGFFTQALPVLLRERGLSLEAIGLTSLLALPWALKFIWAPAVDRLGSRRAWILGAQALSVVALLALALIDVSEGLTWLLVGVFVVNALAATQDIATDGLAVTLLGSGERGWGNGIQVAGYRVGMLLGGGALLMAAGTLGWSGIFLVMAALVGLASLPVWRMKRTPATRGAVSAPMRWRGAWRGALSGKWLGLLLVFKAGDALAQGMLRPWLVDRGLGLEAIGALVGGVGFGAGLVGALVGGGLMSLGARRWAGDGWHTRALAGLGLLQAASIGGYALAADAGWGELAAATAAEHFAGGMATAALFTAMMARCRAEHASTDYTVQASVVVIATGGAAAVSGVLAAALGWALFFQVAAALGLVGAAAALLAGRSPCETMAPEVKSCA